MKNYFHGFLIFIFIHGYYNYKKNIIMSNKGFLVSILTNKRTGDCSANGMSSKTDKAYLVHSDECKSFPEIFEYDEDEKDNVLIVDSITIGNEEPHYFVRKKFETDLEKKKRGPIFGGNFIYCSDSRFPFEYPLPIHDRYELNV